MAKSKRTSFFCSQCGAESPKWAGKCPSCGAWNTLIEALDVQYSPSAGAAGKIKSSDIPVPVSFDEIKSSGEERILSTLAEFDRVLGGGIVKGSLVLLGGDPGIGKSTLLTQVSRALSDNGEKVLYITGEESLAQIKLRADRIGRFNSNMKLLCETDLDLITQVLAKERPGVCVVDSIQTMYTQSASGSQGSPSQIRECSALLLKCAKSLGTAIFLIGHVTKEGAVAGPRILEHMVDTVLYFEGDSLGVYRVLRSVKNRFGSTNEIGVFEMETSGLKEVCNPSAFMLEGRPKGASGNVVGCAICGSRPILLEIQALVCPSVLQNPRRTAAGFDFGRMNLLAAVLEKRAGLRISACDVYVNVVGGIRISETALDLALALAIASSHLDFVIDPCVIAVGEVGLSGEIRNVSQMEARIREAAKMGFEKCLVPASFKKSSSFKAKIQLLPVSTLTQAIELAGV